MKPKIGVFQHKRLTGETKEGKKKRKKSKAKSPRMIGTKPLGFCSGRTVLAEHVGKEAQCP